MSNEEIIKKKNKWAFTLIILSFLMLFAGQHFLQYFSSISLLVTDSNDSLSALVIQRYFSAKVSFAFSTYIKDKTNMWQPLGESADQAISCNVSDNKLYIFTSDNAYITYEFQPPQQDKTPSEDQKTSTSSSETNSLANVIPQRTVLPIDWNIGATIVTGKTIEIFGNRYDAENKENQIMYATLEKPASSQITPEKISENTVFTVNYNPHFFDSVQIGKTVWLFWADYDADAKKINTLYYSTLQEGTWSDPQEVKISEPIIDFQPILWQGKIHLFYAHLNPDDTYETIIKNAYLTDDDTWTLDTDNPLIHKEKTGFITLARLKELRREAFAVTVFRDRLVALLKSGQSVLQYVKMEQGWATPESIVTFKGIPSVVLYIWLFLMIFMAVAIIVLGISVLIDKLHLRKIVKSKNSS